MIFLLQVLLLIGENFENNDLICGVVVNVRAKCKISELIMSTVGTYIKVYCIKYVLKNALFSPRCLDKRRIESGCQYGDRQEIKNSTRKCQNRLSTS